MAETVEASDEAILEENREFAKKTLLMQLKKNGNQKSVWTMWWASAMLLGLQEDDIFRIACDVRCSLGKKTK